MTTIYRIYTEDRDNLIGIVARYFKGATVYHATGVWQGDIERSAVIEVIDVDNDATVASRIKDLASTITRENDQYCALVLSYAGVDAFTVYQKETQS